jgi:hypothetical protein
MRPARARSIGDLPDIVRALKAKGAALKATEHASGGALISTEARSRRGTSVSMTSLSRMAHSRFSTDLAEVSASRHPNARLSFRSRPETDRRAQLARRGDLPPSVQVQSCLQPRNGEG